jgi:Bacterial SH3 domain
MALQYTVDATSLNVRSAPVVAGNIIATLPNGQIVTKLVETSEYWWQVSTMMSSGAITGFVAKKYLRLLDVEYKVIATTLNLRSDPVINPSNILASLPQDQVVKKLEVTSDSDWWKVSTIISGIEAVGFVANRFLAPLNDPFEGKKVVGIDNTTMDFRNKVVQIAERLKTKPIFLMAVMSFETGGTFSPSIRNRSSGATGLIQFLASTARSLQTSLTALAKMTALEQLDYVERYLNPFTGRLRTLEDAYMAVLWPIAVGQGRNYILFSSPSREYRQNRGLDLNGDGAVTALEAANKVASRII